MEFKRPRVVGRRHEYPDTARLKFLVEFFCVFNTYPHPGAASPLTSAAQIKTGTVSVHAGEILVAPVRVREAELVHIKPEAALHVLHTQDCLRVLEMDSDRRPYIQ
jgi:hypothetical protein